MKCTALSTLLVMSVVNITACRSSIVAHPSESGYTQSAGNRAIVTILFLGLSSADGVGVSEQQWQAFLREVVTPKFPDGLTVINAYGQYLSENKKITAEHSKLLLLVHPDDPVSRDYLAYVVGEYKRRFKQESVLRIDADVRAEF